jgi:hypothetical protein
MRPKQKPTSGLERGSDLGTRGTLSWDEVRHFPERRIASMLCALGSMLPPGDEWLLDPWSCLGSLSSPCLALRDILHLCKLQHYFEFQA